MCSRNSGSTSQQAKTILVCAFFETGAVQRHELPAQRAYEQQVEALDQVAAQLINQAAADAAKQKVTRH